MKRKKISIMDLFDKIVGNIINKKVNFDYNSRIIILIIMLIIFIFSSILCFNIIKLNNIDVFYVILTILLFILLISVLLELLELLYIPIKKDTKYQIALRRILKGYDRYIVETINFINLSSFDVIEVKNFQELLDARRNLKLPIIYYDVIKNKKSNFYIKHDKTIYLYVLKESDFKKS